MQPVPSADLTVTQAESDSQDVALSLDPLSAALAVAGMDDKSFWCSFKPESEEEKAMVHNALNRASIAVADSINKIFPVTNALLHRVTVEDEQTHQPKDLIRLVLIGPEGELVSTCSGGALKSLLNLMQICGPMPWNPARHLLIHQVSTKRKRRTFVFEYLPDSALPPAGTKKSK